MSKVFDMGTKKSLSILFTAFSGVLILDTLNISHGIVFFLMAGIIPGTNFSIDANTMLIIFALATGFTLSRITVRLLTTVQLRLASRSTRRGGHASTGTILSAHN